MASRSSLWSRVSTCFGKNRQQVALFDSRKSKPESSTEKKGADDENGGHLERSIEYDPAR